MKQLVQLVSDHGGTDLRQRNTKAHGVNHCLLVLKGTWILVGQIPHAPGLQRDDHSAERPISLFMTASCNLCVLSAHSMPPFDYSCNVPSFLQASMLMYYPHCFLWWKPSKPIFFHVHGGGSSHLSFT